MRTARLKMSIAIDVTIPCDAWNALPFDVTSVAEKIVARTFDRAEKPAIVAARETEACVVLSDDAAVQILNRDYRGKDAPTNVLSFALLDEAGDETAPSFSAPCDMPVSLGDIVLAYETVEREAAAMDISFEHHYIHLLVHGTLHLLGYDHQAEEEAKIMENLEISILAQLGIENPYSRPVFVA